ncbi:hypothetical protein [Neorickettsia findlayensis]|uniref:Uncharacterized protein n=1 Tax=Neorickettsia findlayensis TaxID=2686014 RepID=A0A6P1GAT5_9RICK|nr:hypothetical protein [Neorickettsia findlayensis]QHD65438.1 hypothetical protein GP480_03340 [Neorickettsia findlayensis]
MQNPTGSDLENPGSPRSPASGVPSTPIPSPAAFVVVESEGTASSISDALNSPVGFNLFLEEPSASPSSPSTSTYTGSEESDEESTSSQEGEQTPGSGGVSPLSPAPFPQHQYSPLLTLDASQTAESGSSTDTATSPLSEYILSPTSTYTGSEESDEESTSSQEGEQTPRSGGPSPLSPAPSPQNPYSPPLGSPPLLTIEASQIAESSQSTDTPTSPLAEDVSPSTPVSAESGENSGEKPNSPGPSRPWGPFTPEKPATLSLPLPSASTSAKDLGGSRGDDECSHESESSSCANPEGKASSNSEYEDLDLSEVFDYCKTLLTCEEDGDVNKARDWLDNTYKLVASSEEFQEACEEIDIVLPGNETPPQRAQPHRVAAEGVPVPIRAMSGKDDFPESKHRKPDTTPQDDEQPSTSGVGSTAGGSRRGRRLRQSSGASSSPLSEVQPHEDYQTNPSTETDIIRKQSNSEQTSTPTPSDPPRTQPRRRAAQKVLEIVRLLAQENLVSTGRKRRKLDTTPQDDEQPSTSGFGPATSTSQGTWPGKSDSTYTVDSSEESEPSPSSLLSDPRTQGSSGARGMH